jgi:hypothetical protein
VTELPADVDAWAERVAIIWANTSEDRRTPSELRYLEIRIARTHLNRSVEEAKEIEHNYWSKNA